VLVSVESCNGSSISMFLIDIIDRNVTRWNGFRFYRNKTFSL